MFYGRSSAALCTVALLSMLGCDSVRGPAPQRAPKTNQDRIGDHPKAASAAPSQFTGQFLAADDSLNDLAAQATWCYQKEMYGGARRIWTEVLQKAEQSHGEDHWLAVEARVWLDHLDRIAALSKEDRLRLAQLRLLGDDARLAELKLDFETARAKREQAVAVARTLFGEGDAGHIWHLEELLLSYVATYDTEQARRVALRVLALQETLRGKESPEYATSLCHLARVHMKLDMLGEADRLLQAAYETACATLGKDTLTSARMLTDMARCRYRQERYEETARLCEQAAQALREAENIPEWILADNSIGLAAAQEALGRYGEASETLLQALAKLDPEAKYEEDRSMWGTTQCRLSVVLARLGELREATQVAERGVAAVRRIEGLRKPIAVHLIEAQEDFAFVMLSVGHMPRARTLIRQIVEQYECIWGSEHSAVGEALILAGRIDGVSGQHQQAAETLRRALKIAEDRRGVESLFYAEAADALGYEYVWLGRTDEARPLLEQALANRRKRLPAGHDKIAISLFHLAVLEMAQDNLAQSETHLREALQIYEKAIGVNHPEYAIMLDAHAEMLRRAGRDDEARQIKVRLGPILERLKEEGCVVEHLHDREWPPVVSNENGRQATPADLSPPCAPQERKAHE